jgi:Pyruvate/2-oxoacid:ferredoxin oxidoreductase delta subunit
MFQKYTLPLSSGLRKKAITFRFKSLSIKYGTKTNSCNECLIHCPENEDFHNASKVSHTHTVQRAKGRISIKSENLKLVTATPCKC